MPTAQPVHNDIMRAINQLDVLSKSFLEFQKKTNEKITELETKILELQQGTTVYKTEITVDSDYENRLSIVESLLNSVQNYFPEGEIVDDAKIIEVDLTNNKKKKGQ